MNIITQIVANIKRIIKSKGLKQAIIAEKIGVTSNEFSNMLHGRKLIRVEHIPLIATALGVTVSELYRDTKGGKRGDKS